MPDSRDEQPVESFTLWLEFEHWTPEPGDDPDDDYFNMKVTLASGRTYALNVWTYRFLELAIEATRSGAPPHDPHCVIDDVDPPGDLAREYLVPPDLVVARLDRTLLEQIVAQMLRRYRGQLLPQWESPPPPD